MTDQPASRGPYCKLCWDYGCSHPHTGQDTQPQPSLAAIRAKIAEAAALAAEFDQKLANWNELIAEQRSATTQPQPAPHLDLDTIQAALHQPDAGTWWNDGHEIYIGENGVPFASQWIGETCNVDLPDGGEGMAAAIVTVHNAMPALIAYARHLEARTTKADADLTEMTHCRDNAIRALRRDDIDTDLDIEDVIANELAGQGWDWEDDDAPRNIAELLAPAIRPALAKATQQRDQALARVASLEAEREGWAENSRNEERIWAARVAELEQQLAATRPCTCKHPVSEHKHDSVIGRNYCDSCPGDTDLHDYQPASSGPAAPR